MKKIGFILLITCVSIYKVSGQSQADSNFYQTRQSQWLMKKTGSWNVTMTLMPSATAVPMAVTQLEAERTMVGAFCLHEVMHPAKGAAMPWFDRISDLDYNFNDMHWDYMSIDTRITGGIMNFTNTPVMGDSIVSYIFNFTHPGFGPKQTDRGKSVRVRNIVTQVNENHDIVKQYWKLTDGNEWLAVVYNYVRRKKLFAERLPTTRVLPAMVLDLE